MHTPERIRHARLFGIAVLFLVTLAGCGKGGGSGVTAEEARGIAKDAYVYGFPLAMNYTTMYKQAIDAKSPDFRAPFNTVGHNSGVATPNDKFVVTPNSDTPYSFVWMDLRAEPVVVTMPKIEPSRYYTCQLVDLYTHNFAYLGTRAFGNDGGNFLIAGPGWNGQTPPNVKAVIRCETQFAYGLIRTQLFNVGELARVKEIQAHYAAQPLSKFAGTAAPAAAPAIDWPAPAAQPDSAADVYRSMNFVLQFCPTDSSETALTKRFAKLDIGAGKTFDESKLSPAIRQAIGEGHADAAADMDGVMKQINEETVMSSNLFGTRAFLKNNYLYRYAGAKLGLYGNSGEEAIYYAYFVDENNEPADASKHDYALTFTKGQFPPAHAFWSVTMYDGKSQLLVANPLERYLLNSTTLKQYKYGADGSLTLYLQKASPGKANEANWLPAPDGPFYAVLRMYMPAPEVVSGEWKKPKLHPTK